MLHAISLLVGTLFYSLCECVYTHYTLCGCVYNISTESTHHPIPTLSAYLKKERKKRKYRKRWPSVRLIVRPSVRPSVRAVGGKQLLSVGVCRSGRYMQILGRYAQNDTSILTLC